MHLMALSGPRFIQDIKRFAMQSRKIRIEQDIGESAILRCGLWGQTRRGIMTGQSRKGVGTLRQSG